MKEYFTKEKIGKFIKKAIFFLLNPRFLLCFGIAWLITNGWAYIAFGIGTYLKTSWLIMLSSTYLTFLWFPFTPEKLITVIIAIALLNFLFPNDKKTLAILKNLKAKISADIKNKKNKNK